MTYIDKQGDIWENKEIYDLYQKNRHKMLKISKEYWKNVEKEKKDAMGIPEV